MQLRRNPDDWKVKHTARTMMVELELYSNYPMEFLTAKREVPQWIVLALSLWRIRQLL